MPEPGDPSPPAGGPAALPSGALGRLIGAMMAVLNRDMEWEAAARLGLHGAESVLEIGFGPGVGIAALIARLPRGRVAGVDPSAAMVALARRRNRAAGDSGAADLRCGGVSSLPWPDDAFDAAMAVNCAQLWPHPDHDAAEVLRVVRPGGRCVLALRAGHARLIERLEAIGRNGGCTTQTQTRRVRTGTAVFLCLDRPPRS